MKHVCTDAMYEAFKAVMTGPTADNECHADLCKNAIEAAMAANVPAIPKKGMITTHDCQPLFDAFIAEGLNTQQLLRDAASIVQNDGVEMSNRDVEDWAEDLTQKLMQHHRKQLLLVTNTLHALKGMSKC